MSNRLQRLDTLIFVAVAALCGLVACSADEGDNLSPDPSITTSGSSSGSGGSGGATSSSASTSSSEAATSASSSSSSSGTGGNSAAGFVSGSRLRARFIEGGDGSKQFLGFHDSDKGVNCTFKAVDNSTDQRCFPEVTVASFQSLSSSTRYVDANCTIPAPRVPTCAATPPPFVSVGVCSVRSTWQVTGQVTGYGMSTNNCYLSVDQVYVVTEVPITDWELGAEMVE